MLSVNLLPPEEKQVIRMLEAARAVSSFAVFALSVFAAGLFFLLPSFFLTHFAAREAERSFAIEQRETVQRREARTALAEAKRIKEAVAEIKDYLARSPSVSRILERFFPVSEGITVTSLAVRSDGEVRVDGRAGTREQLLTFEEALRASDQFLEVAFPLENIVRERNIQFSVKAKLKQIYHF